MFDTSLTIGDEILQKVLGNGTDKHMHSIVATIQQDQNKIIRHDTGRLLIVHGAAGSGKTSAAMQRIAYLLYKYREQINADQIILFSPNSMFNSYVSNVLPELGEENMQQVTFQEYLDHRLGKEFEVENPYGQLEYVLTGEKTPPYSSRIAGIQFKASTQFFEAIQSYRKSLELSGMIFKGIRFKGKSIVTAEQITKKFYSSDTSLRFHNRLDKLKDWLLQKLKEAEKIERTKPWIQEEIELLSNEQYHKIHTYLAKKRGFKEKILPIMRWSQKHLLHLWFAGSLSRYEMRSGSSLFVDIKGIYKQLFADPLYIKALMDGETPDEWENICTLTKEMLDEGNLFYEDATPFLLLKELILGFQTNSSIKHIVVDEPRTIHLFNSSF